jgi:hypothetical protein
MRGRTQLRYPTRREVCPSTETPFIKPERAANKRRCFLAEFGMMILQLPGAACCTGVGVSVGVGDSVGVELLHLLLLAHPVRLADNP